MNRQLDLFQVTTKNGPYFAKKKMRPSKKELLKRRYLRMGLDKFRAEQLANYNQ